jgi:hypothetical protein
MYVSIYLSLSVTLSICLSVLPPPVRPSVCLSVCLSVRPSVHPSIYLSIYPIYLSIYGSTVLLLDLVRFLSVLTYKQSVGLLGRGISPSQGRYLHTEQHKQNKRTQTSMPWVRFEPTIPAFEHAETALIFSNSIFDCRVILLVSWKIQKCLLPRIINRLIWCLYFDRVTQF